MIRITYTCNKNDSLSDKLNSLFSHIPDGDIFLVSAGTAHVHQLAVWRYGRLHSKFDGSKIKVFTISGDSATWPEVSGAIECGEEKYKLYAPAGVSV